MKRDNTSLADKVEMRVDHMPDGPVVRVLDAFAGAGLVWREVQRRLPGTRFEITAIDKRKMDAGTFACDNRRALRMLDLNDYDVIDLDAYGFPYVTLALVFARWPEGKTVHVTAGMGAGGRSCLPTGLLLDLGYTHQQIGRCRTVCQQNQVEKIKRWLGIQGIKKLWQRVPKRNVYYWTFELSS